MLAPKSLTVIDGITALRFSVLALSLTDVDECCSLMLASLRFHAA
jgi:hypothetical protein